MERLQAASNSDMAVAANVNGAIDHHCGNANAATIAFSLFSAFPIQCRLIFSVPAF